MKTWINHLEINPIDRMLNAHDQFLKSRVERDLLDIKSDIPESSKELTQLTKNQQDNGSWLYKNKKSIKK
ncbi:MAG: hypothetical protein MI922_26410, partial [Bacteroidales bacterium]|nr:hypothetical protein [Bacteroidales bacterium]